MSERSWRYLVDDGARAAAGLALDEALMHGVRRGATGPGPTLRLYTYAGAALVGRYQTLAAEIDLPGCARAGLSVSRRPTGGGAIIMGPDQLGVALVIPSPATAPRLLLEELGAGIVDGLGFLGLAAVFGGKNDLLVSGRKVAGLGLYRDEQGALLFHASVLVDLDVDLMLQALTIPAAKLGGAARSAVRERITTVRAELGHPVSTDSVREVVAAGLARRHGIRLREGLPTDEETLRCAELVRSRYANPEWLHETAAAPAGTGSAAFRSGDGLVRVYVAAQQSLATSVLFTGDFTTVPPGLRRLEAALRWRRLDARTVGEVVAHVRGQDASDPGWERDDAIVTAVLTAASRAIDRETVTPVRPRGSCYFPDPADAGSTAGTARWSTK